MTGVGLPLTYLVMFHKHVSLVLIDTLQDLHDASLLDREVKL